MLLYNQEHAVNLINGEITIPNSLKPEDLFKQAFVYLKNGDARLCSNACKAALIEHPEDVNLLCLLARASIALKLFKNAQGYLNEATKLAPKSSIARETYGDLLMVQSRPTEALREYRFVQQLNSQHKQIEQKIEHAILDNSSWIGIENEKLLSLLCSIITKLNFCESNFPDLVVILASKLPFSA